MKIWFCKAPRKYVNYIIFCKRIKTDMIEVCPLPFPTAQALFLFLFLFFFATCSSLNLEEKTNYKAYKNNSQRNCLGIALVIPGTGHKAIWTFPALIDSGHCNLILNHSEMYSLFLAQWNFKRALAQEIVWSSPASWCIPGQLSP